jgi:hypothetical protein
MFLPMLCKRFLAHVIENDFGTMQLLRAHALDPDLSVLGKFVYNLRKSYRHLSIILARVVNIC